MKPIRATTCVLMLMALGLLDACSSHCTCPPPPQPASTTIVTPSGTSHY